MSAKTGVILGTVAGLAAGYVIATVVGASALHEQEADARRRLDEETAKAADLATGRQRAEAELTRRSSEVRELQAKLSAAERDAAELRTQVDSAKAELEAARAAAAPGPKAAEAPAVKGPRFSFDQYAKLAEVDWKVVGENLRAMTPLCARIVEKLDKEGELDAEALGDVQKHNGPLVTTALKLQGQVPGMGVNGMYTHPAFQANAIAAALAAAGTPLTDEQAAAVERLAREFTEEDERRRQAYDASTYQLQKVLDEADLRRRFFDAVFAKLTPEQYAVLEPPGVRGRIGLDLFSEGLQLAQFLRPVQYRDTDHLVATAAATMQTGLHLTAEQEPAAKEVVGKWVRDLPTSITEAGPGTPVPGLGTTAATAAECGRQTVTLLRRLVTDLKLEGPPAESARKWLAILLPVPGAD